MGSRASTFIKKRAKKARPPWVEVAVSSRFPSGRVAEEVGASRCGSACLACESRLPRAASTPRARGGFLEHPDELRVDLDPMPGVTWQQVQEVTFVARAVLDDFKLVGWPKTSGSRGMHICVRLQPRWDFDEVRRAALALAREVEKPRADARHQQVVEGGASRRVRRLQPEREGSHRGRGVLRATQAGRARIGAALVGRSCRLRPGGFHARLDADAVQQER